MKTNTTKPLVQYYLSEQDVQKLEHEARRWKRAALRLARVCSSHALWMKGEPIGKAIDTVAKLNGGKL